MTAEGEPPSEEIPYSWDDSALPPTEVFQLWTEVGNGIDKSQTGAFPMVILCRGDCEGFSLLNLDWKHPFRG
jgi:hypothetical protein